MFKFTFNLGSSAAINPFTAQAEERERLQQAVAPQTIKRKLPAPPRRPSPPPSIADDVPRTRKRGWAPTSSSASEAISQPTLTNGWIDTPAKYLAQASQSRGGGDEEDLPPAKRRKTLTDSIITTAFSAALIGTAVGMTAYRMWRDRGKSSEEPMSTHMDAPPPYQREEWVDDTPRAQPAGRTPRPHKKPRPVTRRAPRHRKTPIATSPAQSPARVVSPSSFASAKQEESKDDRGELEDQMDWMGDKIRRLIEEGQKALGKEIVIKTDDQHDEDEGAIDDGMEGWEEDQDSYAAGPSSATSSSRRRPAKPLAINTSITPPTLHGHGFPASYSSTASASRTRPQYTTGGSYSETSPGLGSPYLAIRSGNKLGRRHSNEEDVKVLYEPGALASNIHHDDVMAFEDEDGRQLTQGLNAVRKAYNIQ